MIFSPVELTHTQQLIISIENKFQVSPSPPSVVVVVVFIARFTFAANPVGWVGACLA